MFRLGSSLAISTLAHLLLLIGLSGVMTHARDGDLNGCFESATCEERIAASSKGLPSGSEQEAVYIASILPAPSAPRAGPHEQATRVPQPQEKLERPNIYSTRMEPVPQKDVWPREDAKQADAGGQIGKNNFTSAVVPMPARQQGDLGTQGGGGSGSGLPFGRSFVQSFMRPKVLRGPKPSYPLFLTSSLRSRFEMVGNPPSVADFLIARLRLPHTQCQPSSHSKQLAALAVCAAILGRTPGYLT